MVADTDPPARAAASPGVHCDTVARIAAVSDAALGPAELVDAIRKRRGGSLLNLDRMLLNSPAYAVGWNTFLGAVRTALSLEPKLRELAICAVAVLNRADYELLQHAPEWLAAGGTQAQLQHLPDCDAAWGDAALFSPTERAVLQLALEMTRQVQVSDACFARVQQALGSAQQQVELVGVIAAYNMVSRFLEALRVAPEADSFVVRCATD
jgi:alkylhydroperoxidase family enzyme